MRVGVTPPLWSEGGAPLSAEMLLTAAADVEEAGLDGIWMQDMLNRGYAALDPLTAAAAIGACTTRVEIGTAVLQVARHEPVDLASRVLSTVLVCNGRFTLGAGAGSTRDDFDAVGVDFDARFQRLGTNLRTIKALLAGESVGDVNLHPWSQTIGLPPIVIGSWAGSRWIPRAAREFDGWMGSAAKTTYDALVGGLAVYRASGGRRAIASNLLVDLDVVGNAFADDSPLDLRCRPSEATDRLKRLEDAGFDDVTLTIFDHTPRHLATLRSLVP